jgi:hypothetical protein
MVILIDNSNGNNSHTFLFYFKFLLKQIIVAAIYPLTSYFLTIKVCC